MNILKSPLFQTLRNKHHTCAVQRSINNLQVLLTFDYLRVDRDRLNLLEVSIVHLFTDNLDERLVSSKLHIVNLNLVHLIYYTDIMRRQHLCSVLPICLISVILTRIMRSCYVHTSLTSEMAYRERTLRCRTHVVEKIHLDAVCGEDVSYCLGKQAAVVTAVVAHDYRNRTASGKILFQIICKALCSHSHCVNVHSVTACSHYTAESAGTEFQIFVETLYQLCLVTVVKHSLNRLASAFVKRRRQPLFCLVRAQSNQFCIIFHN